MQSLKPFIAGAIIAVCILSTIACNQQPGATVKEDKPVPSATKEELGQMNRDFAKALTAHDAKAAAELYDVNASILPPNEKMITGRDKIQQYWQGGIDAGIIDATVETIDAKSTGDQGYEIGRFVMRSKGPKGDTIVEKGKYTEILKRDSTTGKWMSTYGMWSTDEPAH